MDLEIRGCTTRGVRMDLFCESSLSLKTVHISGTPRSSGGTMPDNVGHALCHHWECVPARPGSRRARGGGGGTGVRDNNPAVGSLVIGGESVVWQANLPSLIDA